VINVVLEMIYTRGIPKKIACGVELGALD